MITVKNKRTYKGPGVYIGRPSVLGNPFQIGKDGTREVVCSKYEEYMRREYKHNSKYAEAIDYLVEINTARQPIVLICWCAPLQCHGDSIKKFVEELTK